MDTRERWQGAETLGGIGSSYGSGCLPTLPFPHLVLSSKMRGSFPCIKCWGENFVLESSKYNIFCVQVNQNCNVHLSRNTSIPALGLRKMFLTSDY